MFIRKLGRMSDKADHKCMMMIYESYCEKYLLKRDCSLIIPSLAPAEPVTSREGDYWKLIFTGETVIQWLI